VAFREVLQHAFQSRQARNPRYSLRSFARFLALDHSSLSQILRGRRRLTTRTIRDLGTRLGLPYPEIELLCAEENDRALLAAVRHPAFRADARWIATLLGIPTDAVNVALQRLVRTGTLVMGGHTWEVR
jgi:transcriptional regulator with XRE-family HTH domain